MSSNSGFLFRILWSNLARKFYVWILAIIIFFSLMNWVVMPWYVNDGGTVTVPDLNGLNSSEAKHVLDTLGLLFELGGTKVSKLAPNTVLSQNPDAGSAVKHGRRIYVVLSGGVEKATVPDLRGHSRREAQFMLERAGFNLGNVTSDTSSEFPQDVVMAQSVSPNSSVATGTAISISVSAGSISSEEVTVPDLVGKSLPDAQKAIMTASLVLGKITFQPSAKLVPNTVLQQYPRAQEVVPKGTHVELFVSTITNAKEGPEN